MTNLFEILIKKFLKVQYWIKNNIKMYSNKTIEIIIILTKLTKLN